MARNCGECLMNDVEVVELDPLGICPRCGADYGSDGDSDATGWSCPDCGANDGYSERCLTCDDEFMRRSRSAQ